MDISTARKILEDHGSFNTNRDGSPSGTIGNLTAALAFVLSVIEGE